MPFDGIRPYMTKELAAFYSINKKTMIKWIEEIEGKVGKRRGYYYSVTQVRVIFEIFGMPEYIKPKKAPPFL